MASNSTLLIRLRCLLWLTALPFLGACASLDTMQIFTSSAATVDDQQACVAPPLHPSSNNTQSAGEQGLDPEDIALLNWNIYKGNGDGWQKDLATLAQNHNVMTLQEAMLSGEFTGLLQDYNFNWVMNAGFELNGLTAGVMTAAHKNVIHSCGLKIREPIIRLAKSTLLSYYSIDGSDESLLVANIHGINFTAGIGAYRQQLEQLYHALKHHHGPMIIAGDFNSWSDARVIEMKTLVSRLSLSWIDYPVNNKTHVFGKAIDHVFYRGLEVVSNQVWQVSSSDHNPLSVRFRLKKV